MKHKKFKLLALPLAVASASVIGMVSGTLAYFTSQDKATVSIEAGQVKIDMALSNLSLYSLDVEQTEAGTEGGKSVTYFENHGFALLENNVLTLSKITPGDKVSFKATITNNSNVDTKYALIIDYANEHTGLENGYVPHAGDHVTATKKLSEGLVTTGLTSGTALINIDVGDTVERVVTIELPKEAGDQYQDASGEIVIKAVALQRNAPMTAELYLELANAHTRSEAYPGASIAKLNTVGMDILNEPCLAGLDLVWNDLSSDFRIGSYSLLNSVHDWAFVSSISEMSASNTYSSYLLGNSLAGSITTAAGVDVGENAGISAINYEHTTAPAQDVVIRTNSLNTTLTINDSSTGNIRHYGFAGELNIIQCHTASYHEYGTVAFAEIAKGRIVLESGSEIKHIHVDKKDNASFDTVIIADNGAKALPEKITRDEVTVTTETLVVTVESNGSSEKVYVYADGTTGTTEKTTTQNTEVESALGQLVLDNGEDSKALSPEAKTEAQKEAVVEAANIEIALDPTSLTLQKDGTAKIIATVNTSANYNYILSWTSSNPKVATVDENGNVTGVADGSATITATAGNKTATCTVMVTSGIAITKSSLTDGKKEINQGGSYYLAEDIEGQLIITGGIIVTLDLNGFTIGITQTTTQADTANHAKDVVYVKDGATVTIKDSSEGPTGKILNTFNGANPGNAYALCIEDSTVTLESGTIEYSSSGNSGSNMAVGVGHMPYGGTDISSNESNYGKFIIDGGEIRRANSDAGIVIAYFATVEVKNPYAFGTDGMIYAIGGTITYSQDSQDKFTESTTEDGFLIAVRGAN